MIILEVLNWLAVPVVAFFFVKKFKGIRERDGKRLEIFAASSLAMVILNPDILRFLLWNGFKISHGGLWGGAGSGEFLSFGYGLITVVLSMIGLRRIMLDRDKLYGVFYAIPGLVFGLAIIGFWLWVGYTFVSGWN